MAGFKSFRYFSEPGTSTATNSVMIQSMDVSNFDKFSLIFKNCATSNPFVDLKIEASAYPADSAANTAPTWIEVHSSIMSVPSALGSTATVMTIPVDNTYHYLRVLGRTTNSAATARVLEVQVQGFERY